MKAKVYLIKNKEIILEDEFEDGWDPQSIITALSNTEDSEIATSFFDELYELPPIEINVLKKFYIAITKDGKLAYLVIYE